MKVLGIFMMSVGLILLVSARSIYSGGLKTVKKYENEPKDNDHFLMLIQSGMLVLKIVGGVLLLIGSLIFIL